MPIGGALKLKGGPLPTKDKKKKKKKRDRDEYETSGAKAAEEGGAHSSTTATATHDGRDAAEGQAAAAAASAEPKDDGLTPAQRRHLERLRDREKQLMKKVLSKTHRERIDEFNQYLSVLTEHNDIPRVSAAGNG